MTDDDWSSRDEFHQDPFEDLEPREREWRNMLESDPATFWKCLVTIFSDMNDRELRLQQEVYQKARLQSEEAAHQVPDEESLNAVEDIHEILLLLESAANEANKDSESQ
jgi:hypothetical protein